MSDDALQSLISDLLAVLQEEHRCLLYNDIESLGTLSARKVALVEQVEDAFDHRLDVEAGLSLEEIQLLEACKQQNQINGYLLASRRNLVAELLMVFSANTHEPFVYTSGGAVSSFFKGIDQGIA
jgi:flagellar biosynthesis/type III secretory pathway chaperone